MATQTQQELKDKIRARTPDMVQQAIDNLLGFGVTGGISKVVANSFAKFGKVAPSTKQAQLIADELAKAAETNTPLAKGLEKLKVTMQEATTRAAKAKRVPSPTGPVAPLASKLDQLGVQAHVAAHLAKGPALAAGAVVTGAGAAAVIPKVLDSGDSSIPPVPTSLDPVKRQHEAFQAAVHVDKASQPIVAHKPNQKQAVASAELNGVTDPTPYFSGKLSDLKPEDYTTVVPDSRAGQSIYTLTESGRKKMGVKAGKGIGLTIPVPGSANNSHLDTATSMFFNLPNDKVGEAITDASQVTVTKADTPEQALQRASALRDSVYRRALAQRQQDSQVLQGLQANLDRAQKYANVGDPRAIKDVPKFQAQMAQEMDNIDIRAQNDAKNNLDVINAHNAAVFTAKNASEKVVAADNLAKSLSDLTGLPTDVTTMLAHSPVSGREMAKWKLDRDVSGEPKLINTSGNIYNDLTVGRTRQIALGAKENPGVVNAELSIVKTARTTALETFLKANPTLKKGETVSHDKNQPSFISSFRTLAQDTLMGALIKQAKGVDFTDSPQKDLERMAKEGKTSEEIRNTLNNNLKKLELDTVMANIGITAPQLNRAIQAEIDKYFSPAGLFGGTGQQPLNSAGLLLQPQANTGGFI